MEYTHGIVCGINPWYLSTHGTYPSYCKWHPPMVFNHPWYLPTHGIYVWYYNLKKTISNKSHFVKGLIFHHNVAFTIIICFNKKNCGFVYSVFSTFLLSFQFFSSWGPPLEIRISGIIFSLRLHRNEGLMHILVSKFCNNFNKLHARDTTSTKHFLGQSKKKYFLFFIFCRNFLGGDFVDQI